MNLPCQWFSFIFVQKIKETRKAPSKWNKESFGFVQNKIKKLHDQLDFVQGLPPLDQSREVEMSIQVDL